MPHLIRWGKTLGMLVRIYFNNQTRGIACGVFAIDETINSGIKLAVFANKIGGIFIQFINSPLLGSCAVEVGDIGILPFFGIIIRNALFNLIFAVGFACGGIA